MLRRHAETLARLALAWAVISALPRFYWGAGGRAGVRTLRQQWQDYYQDVPGALPPEFGMINVGLLMLLVAFAVLVALQPWGHVLPHPLQVAALAVSAIFLLLYGVVGWVGALLMVTGVIATPGRIGEEPARWALYMWEPWMILGGVLVGLTAIACQRRWLPGTA